MPTTYDELLIKVPKWQYANNRSLVSDMPQVISDAEDQIINMIDHYLFQTVLVDIPVAAGQSDIDLSGMGVLEVRAIRANYRTAGGRTPLERRDLEAMTMLFSANRPARPRFYSQYGAVDMFRLFPTPRTAFDVEVTANVQPPKLGPDQQSNIIAEKFPRVLDRAVMKQAAIYMKNPTDEARYGEEMVSALAEANAQIARWRRDETGTRLIETTNAMGQ